MSKGFSSAAIKGTLGKDPDVRSTPNGTKVANFSVAVERGFGDSKTTDWFNVVAWKSLAEFVEKYLKKGKTVFIAGELQTRSWEDKQTGAKRTVVEVKADRIEFADDGQKSDSGSSGRAPAQTQTRQQTAPQTRQESSGWEASDDDIPF